jgi:hypothetical protein
MGHALKRTTAHEIAFALPLISGESPMSLRLATRDEKE